MKENCLLCSVFLFSRTKFKWSLFTETIILPLQVKTIFKKKDTVELCLPLQMKKTKFNQQSNTFFFIFLIILALIIIKFEFGSGILKVY